LLSALDMRARWVASPLSRVPAILATWLALPARTPLVRLYNPLWPITPWRARRALAVVAVILAMMIFVDRGAIETARRLPVWLTSDFDFISDFGKSGWFLVPLGTLLLSLAVAASVARSRRTFLTLTSVALRLWFLFLAIALPGLFTDALKFVGRARPFVTGIADPFAYSFFDWRSDYQSLPSGHATTAFAAAVAFGALWPRARPMLWVYAVAIAVSRVVITAHHPSDVVAGAIVGILGAMLIRNWFAARRLVFLVDGAGIVRARPGPSLRRMGMLRPPAAASVPTPITSAAIMEGRQSDTSQLYKVAPLSSEVPAVSVVIPVRNEAGTIAPLVAELAGALAKEESFEIVFVNDGSVDTTGAELLHLMGERPWLRQIRHARSCGQSASIRTGVAAARAPTVVTLDGDGQNDPAFIPDLLRALREGAPRIGLVAGQRVGRKATRFKKLQSRVANAIRNRILRDGTRDTGCGLKAFDRALFLALPYFDGLHRFLPALVRREGYDIGYVEVVDRERRHGKSNYGFWDRLWVGILDLAGVWWLTRRRQRVPEAEEVR
jgi:dolichol-phosphate mannosyltransferase